VRKRKKMQMIANVLFFILGIHLTMQLIASLYRILDLWYRIGDFLLPVARSIIFYTVIMALIGWHLKGSRESAFIWGCLFFLVFHVSIFWIAQAVIRIKRWRQESAR
jgi:hypothetical protein